MMALAAVFRIPQAVRVLSALQISQTLRSLSTVLNIPQVQRLLPGVSRILPLRFLYVYGLDYVPDIEPAIKAVDISTSTATTSTNVVADIDVAHVVPTTSPNLKVIIGIPLCVACAYGIYRLSQSYYNEVRCSVPVSHIGDIRFEGTCIRSQRRNGGGRGRRGRKGEKNGGSNRSRNGGSGLKNSDGDRELQGGSCYAALCANRKRAWKKVQKRAKRLQRPTKARHKGGSFGNFYKTGKKTWVSWDRGGHAGSAMKLWREMGKEFHFIKSIDSSMKRMKHKHDSLKGVIIKFSDMKFYN